MPIDHEAGGGRATDQKDPAGMKKHSPDFGIGRPPLLWPRFRLADSYRRTHLSIIR
jgi:hypothetical protein